MATIEMKKYGYASRAAFLRDENPTLEAMNAMAQDEEWAVQKSVLLHPKCPIEIRDAFSKSPIWYMRLVAFFATKAPEGYWKKAEGDPSVHVRAAFKRKYEWEILTPEEKEADYRKRLLEHEARVLQLDQLRNGAA